MSPQSARKAEEAGYKNLKVFQPGLPAWKKDGGLIVSEPRYVMDMLQKDIAHVLVDLRDKGTAKKSHIPGAVNIEAKALAKYKDKFPQQMDAPVILYTADGIDDGAFSTVRGWGYKNASVLNGGAAGWTAADGKLLEGQLAKKIVYEPKPLPGTITADEFDKTVAERPKDKLILDVRDADEAMLGMLPGAVNIPIADLDKRMAELPKDKEIITHCSTGIRAMMARDTLVQNGYKARYLNEVIQIAPDGSYEITK